MEDDPESSPHERQAAHGPPADHDECRTEEDDPDVNAGVEPGDAFESHGAGEIAQVERRAPPDRVDRVEPTERDLRQREVKE